MQPITVAQASSESSLRLSAVLAGALRTSRPYAGGLATENSAVAATSSPTEATAPAATRGQALGSGNAFTKLKDADHLLR